MLDFLKKLVYSNKYALLVLLILSLWLRLANDYSIILSYIVLILLYVIIGLLVEYLLDRLGYGESKVDNTKNVNRTESKRSAVSRDVSPEKKRNEPVRQEVRHRRERSTESTVKSVAPVSRSTSTQNNIQKRVRDLNSNSSDAKVTSSYIKNAGSIPRDMEKKLVRTAATFHSIKEDAENVENSTRVYGTVRRSYIRSDEDLYTNKKREPEVEKSVKNQAEEDIPGKEVQAVSLEKTVIPTTEYSSYDDYSTASSDELGKISDDISKEVERRISSSRTTRHAKVVMQDDLSFLEKPARQSAPTRQTANRTQQQYNRTVKTDVESVVKEQPVNSVSQVKPEKTAVERKVSAVFRDSSADDHVSADMDKIDRLFNRNRNDDYSEEKQSKTGLWNRFKKKR